MADTKTQPVPRQAESEKPRKPIKRSVQAPIGWPIQWFSLGLGSEEPKAAVCVGHMGTDMCTIEVNSGGAHHVVESCPHLSDPLLILHPVVAGIDPDGAWDYVPGLVPEKDRDIDSVRTRVVQLSLLHHWAPQQIAKAARINQAIVEAILEGHASGKA